MATTRRQLLQGLGLATSGLLLPGCAEHVVRLMDVPGKHGQPGVVTPKGPEFASSAPPAHPDEVLLGLYPRGESLSAKQAVLDLCSRLDWSWLRRGDRVFVKLSANSRHPHPAATSPNAVRAVVRRLLDLGAGQVLVGDQGGVECTRLAAGNRRFHSTRGLFAQNGLLQAIEESGAVPHFFDEGTYEDGYIEVEPPSGSHWREPLRIARVAGEVDHIIYLPRLCSHVLAGYTHGHKIAIGWMREDSRFHLHYKAADYHRKFVEISYCNEIRSRLRLVITLNEQMLLGVGPDHGTPGHTNCYVVLGSRHLANHDAVSVAVLAYVDQHTPNRIHIIPPSYGPFTNLSNWEFITAMVPGRTKFAWGNPKPTGYEKLPLHAFKLGVAHDLGLTRAYQIVGALPDRVPVTVRGPLDAKFRQFLAVHDSGRLRLGV